MGYQYSVYGVDVKKLAKVWGKRDKKLGNAIRVKHADDIKRNNEWFDDDIVEKGAPTLGRAIWEILEGKCERKTAGFQYGYATESFCRYFGERIDNDLLSWFAEVLDPALKRAKQPPTNKLLGVGVRPFKIPPPDNFPEMGMLDADGCKRLDKALAAVSLDTDDEEDELVMVVTEVRTWAKRGQKKRGMVWFVY